MSDDKISFSIYLHFVSRTEQIPIYSPDNASAVVVLGRDVLSFRYLDINSPDEHLKGYASFFDLVEGIFKVNMLGNFYAYAQHEGSPE